MRLNANMERSSIETYELSPDGPKSIDTYRSLEQAIERAKVLLSSRVDVGYFAIYSSTGLGRRLVGTVSRKVRLRRDPYPLPAWGGPYITGLHHSFCRIFRTRWRLMARASGATPTGYAMTASGAGWDLNSSRPVIAHFPCRHFQAGGTHY